MRKPYAYTLADRDFYEPLARTIDRGREFRPSRVPEGWQGTESGVWTMWGPVGHTLPSAGWKVHVSARPDRLAHVLDVMAGICFEQGVPFKHLSSWLFYTSIHQKHAVRAQSGKFTAAYPADAGAARRLMERLSEALAGEEGPFVLTDRRFGDSHTVHYRYGAFGRRAELRPDGTRISLVPDATGRLVEDRRGISFHLPHGIEDPFTDEAPGSGRGSRSFGGYTFEAVLRHSNGGGAYRAREEATGRTVFVKEARAHTGLGAGGATAQERLRAEWRTLRALHTADPGLAPEPLDYFTEWEHEFLVTEYVPGRALSGWMVANNALIQSTSGPADFAAYYRRCERVIIGIEEEIRRLHDTGHLFVDISPGNVLIDDDDNVRLIDFEAAHRLGTPFVPSGTPGYVPPADLVGDDPAIYDRYGVAALALMLVGPFHLTVLRAPGALGYLRHRLRDRGCAVPEPLWRRATAFHPVVADSALPSPEQVAADPEHALRKLRDRTADALVAMAEPDHPYRVFPTVPEGHLTNTLCVAYGTAGVVHALRRAGRCLPDGVLERLRTDVMSGVDDLAPGLHVGSAGIAWVLADSGLADEAEKLPDHADRHPITTADATLAGGLSGVALTHLALYGHTGDASHVDRAAELAATLGPPETLSERIGDDDATGLLHGRCGIALMLHQLAAISGDEHHLDQGLRLMHHELDRASDPKAPQLRFPISAVDGRRMPYLYCGSAGMLRVAARYVRDTGDERLAEALPRLLTAVTTDYTAMPGLYQGLAGLVFTLAEYTALTGDEAGRRGALSTAAGLFMHAVPHPTGVRFLGDQTLRFSADLWSGSAGILLALEELLGPAPDPLFTVDAAVRG